MEIYIVVDYKWSITYRRSTSSYCIILGGHLITWRSKKQNIIVPSSAKVDFSTFCFDGHHGYFQTNSWRLIPSET
uniref:Retrovirus-related Pol polyprotein from transposon TNT 1-94 n=1 Tax=Cajanus cajan TaxID=3821 RepID=A0A151REL4_CAJCA|nr:hypothetical protein KK1_037745 [Cajanus cajan]